MDAINVIAPSKHHGQRVFDDQRVGLSQEPFVAGTHTWIDRPRRMPTSTGGR
jgi:hypothetical protein